ncbi:uncharacterized protein I206_100153 [Kwoniella pini CBS 10737]|uniref:Uncharacterized protein n=1 Tax=Kwoniella pini CBS 10737 TaxID=1296096 RepID=A0A1B9IDT1_9TREE|nr:uncharacterized protein I206_01175 [Kwoniella pini CBS 10737]OCF53868.1 hypothetical protein I206_01175 [Kwoniella pini CBS 10737]
MYNARKRPTANKPFNPAHTHPASISSLPSIQTRQHISMASSSPSKDKPAVPAEGIQSGGGGGGGAGAGSEEGIEGLGIEKNDEDKEKKGNDKKWSDPKVVHPASDVWGKGPSKEDEKRRGSKAKL